jgi:hypothetical protein
MNSLHIPKLTDGVIFLRPLAAEDAADHLAGEDEEMVKWVSGGRSMPATVETFIRNSQENWCSGGPRRVLALSLAKITTNVEINSLRQGL